LSENFDLFGLPVGKVGRPRKEVTEKERNKIKMLLAVGWNVERMAGVLRMSAPTFRRIFFHEMKEREFMRDRMYARRLEMLFELSEAGNVAALKELGKMLEQQDRFFAEQSMTSAQSDVRAAEPLGKKEIAKALAAEIADGQSDWGADLEFAGRSRSH
jgi:hypothetical protein